MAAHRRAPPSRDAAPESHRRRAPRRSRASSSRHSGNRAPDGVDQRVECLRAQVLVTGKPERGAAQHVGIGKFAVRSVEVVVRPELTDLDPLVAQGAEQRLPPVAAEWVKEWADANRQLTKDR